MAGCKATAANVQQAAEAEAAVVDPPSADVSASSGTSCIGGRRRYFAGEEGNYAS